MVMWATQQDVVDLTGRTVTLADLTLANSVVESVAFAVRGWPSTVNDVSAVDAERLRRAVAFQALLVSSDPAYYSDTATSKRMGDAQVTYSTSGRPLLSLLAAQALAALSWVGDGSGLRAYAVFPPRPFEGSLFVGDPRVR